MHRHSTPPCWGFWGMCRRRNSEWRGLLCAKRPRGRSGAPMKLTLVKVSSWPGATLSVPFAAAPCLLRLQFRRSADAEGSTRHDRGRFRTGRIAGRRRDGSLWRAATRPFIKRIGDGAATQGTLRNAFDPKPSPEAKDGRQERSRSARRARIAPAIGILQPVISHAPAVTLQCPDDSCAAVAIHCAGG